MMMGTAARAAPAISTPVSTEVSAGDAQGYGEVAAVAQHDELCEVVVPGVDEGEAGEDTDEYGKPRKKN